MVFTSCRTEEIEEINTPNNEVIGLNSKISTLIQQTTTNDGSYDNIIDGANCFDVQLPVTVIANGIEVVVNTEEDLDIIEDIFDESSSDTDTLEIQFPITIILEDYSTMVINSQEELNAAAIQCPGENEEDDDIECIDFQYPITAAIYDANNELIDTVTVNNDEELYDLIDEIDEELIIAFNFPITVILSDGTTVVINDLDELEDVIENAEDDCDEDDDNDPNDDDCEDCTVAALEELLIECNPWYVDKLEIDDEDLEDEYDGYLFHFLEEGVLVAEDNSGNETTGTWEATGTGNEIIVSLSITDLSDFNADWNLHEVEEENGGWSVDLRIGDNRLEFRSNCNGGGGGGGNEGDLADYITDGIWIVAAYLDDGNNETSDYNGWEFDFLIDGTVEASNGSDTIEGSWSVIGEDLELVLEFGDNMPLDEFNDEWDVIDLEEMRIELQDVSGGGGGTDTLVFEKL